MSRQPRSYRVQAVVLKRSDYGEADRLLTIYTRQRGKLSAIAKGVRKVRSRKGGHLEPFTHVDLLLGVGKNWDVVSQAEAIDIFDKVIEDLELVGYASYVVELLDKFTFEEEENSSLYRLLVDTLGRLDQGDDPLLAVRYFEVRFLDLMGFRPELQYCVVSGKQIVAEDQYFSASLGGVVSPADGQGLSGAAPVSMDALRYLRHFQRSSYEDALAAAGKISDKTHRELEILMQHYITYLLERGLNTPGFIRRLRSEKERDQDD